MYCFFFFNDTATTEIYTLSLHDALPISHLRRFEGGRDIDVPVTIVFGGRDRVVPAGARRGGRSEEHTSEIQHANISYAGFCLKKKKKILIKSEHLQRSQSLF